jgi:hypothetical protein
VPESHQLAWSRFLATVLRAGVLGWALGAAAPSVHGDDFGGIIGPALFEIPQRFEANRTTHLSIRTIESLPEVVRGERSALIVATTDQGNLAKLLVSPGLQRSGSTGNKGTVVPVISLDRFETIDGGDRVARKARGRDVLLFDRFEFDLDTGQVVPAGFGGDIVFSATGGSGQELIGTGKNVLYAVDKPIAVTGSEPGRPSAGRGVIPADFNGRFTLVSNGQMSGALELTVKADSTVTGRFRSDRNGSIYPVTGKIPGDLTRRIEFEIQFPRSKQAFDGLLWTEEKNVVAGTVQILDHPYSFIAVREGAPLLPESIDAVSPPRAPSPLKATTRVVAFEAAADRYVLDGVPKSAEALIAALEVDSKAIGPVEVLLQVPGAMSFERVQQAVRLVRRAGIPTIRLAVADAP